MILILLLYMALATTFTLGKAALAYIQPIFLVGLRMSLAGSALAGYVYFFKRTWWRCDTKDWRLLAQITVLHIYVAYVLEFVALEHMSSAKACLLYTAAPFITAVFSFIFYAERLRAQQWLALCVGWCGLMIILIEPLVVQGPHTLAMTWSELLLLGSVVAGAQGWIVMQRLVRDEGYNPIMVNAWGMITGGVLALATSLLVETRPFIVTDPDAAYMVALYVAALILIANVIFYNCYGALLRIYSATFLAFAGFTCPIFAALYGRFFLGEPITHGFMLSLLIIGIGLYLFYYQELKKVQKI